MRRTPLVRLRRSGVVVYIGFHDPFRIDGPLRGFRELRADQLDDRRVRSLCRALRLSLAEATDFRRGRVPDGRMVLVSATAHRFAIEGRAPADEPVGRACYQHISKVEPFSQKRGTELLLRLFRSMTYEEIVERVEQYRAERAVIAKQTARAK
jgi:hypothetical protein